MKRPQLLWLEAIVALVLRLLRSRSRWRPSLVGRDPDRDLRSRSFCFRVNSKLAKVEGLQSGVHVRVAIEKTNSADPLR